MRYDEFRDAFFRSLRDAGLRPQLGGPTETIELTTTTRRWEAALGDFIAQRTEPFLVSAMVSFEWDPVESARTHTTEEDLVSELLGREEDPPETMPRQLRTDIVLRATLPYDSRVPLPARKTWKAWSMSVNDDLARFLPTDAAQHEGGFVLVMSACGSVEVEAKCSDAGELCLSAVSFPAWQGVVLPRIRDTVDEEPEGDIARQLRKLAKRYRDAYDAWMECVTELRDEIGFSPAHR